MARRRVQPVDDDMLDGVLGGALGAATTDAGDPGQEAAPSDLDANIPGTVVEEAHSPAAPGEARSTEEAAAPAPGGGGGRETTELAPDAESTTGAEGRAEEEPYSPQAAVQEEQENGRAAGERLPASSDPTSAAAPGPAQAASLAGNKEEPSAEDAVGDHGWSIAEFLRDQHSAESLEGIAAEMLAEARTREFPDDFHWCKHLAREESKGSNVVHAILCEGASASLGQGNFMRRAVEFVQKKLAVLLTQESATALEQNEKFCAQADGFMAYGGLEEYFKGLKGWIGPPDDRDPPKTIHDEHCRSAEADEEIYTGNYGVTTTSIKEWKSVAGQWTPDSRRFDLVKGFTMPRETKNIEEHQKRRMICLYDLMRPPSEEEKQTWAKPGERETMSAEELAKLPQEEQCRRLVWRSGLTAAELIMLRLWTGPMYIKYSQILRGGIKGRFQTSLHALNSAILKISRVSPEGTIYRGLSGRGITMQDLLNKAFLEKGSQSFTTDRAVAEKYAKFAGEGKPSYIITVRQGVIDKGADIGPISFYPYEQEILFGALVMMECINVRIEGAVIVLDVRLNVNALSGTLDDIMNEKSRSVANTAEMFLHELQVKDSVKELAGASRVHELQRVEHEMKKVLEKAPRAFNDPESFQEANALAVETYKGADSHAKLSARIKTLLEDDAGDAALEGEIADLEARLKRRQAELALPQLERRLTALNLWRWVLKPLWLPTFHVLLFLLGLVSAVPAAALACLNVLLSLVARLPLLGALVRASVAAPVAWLAARAFGFCQECLVMMHYKVHGFVSGTWQDRRWALAQLDVERKGLESAVGALRAELGGDGEDGPSSRPLSLRRRDRWGVGVCLALALAASVLFIVFSRVQPWGEPAAAGTRCGADYATDYPTLMLAVGVMAVVLACCCCCCSGAMSQVEDDDEESSTFDDEETTIILIGVCCVCLGTPLAVTALVMWVSLAQSAPACGIELWALGYAALGAGVLAAVCIGLALRALAGGWSAPAPEDAAEIREMQAELRRLWRRGGLRAKPAEDRERIQAAARAALARVSTRELSHAHVCRFIEHAARHLKEACCELPMRSTHVKYPKPALKVGDEKEDTEGLAWLAGVELLQRGYEHEDMERVLELVALGTRQGEQVLRSSELASEWEAAQMAALNVVHEYFDGVNLAQLATGKTTTVHLAAVSPLQAAFLAAFVSLHAPGPVAVVLPPPAVRIVLAGRADSRVARGGGSEGAAHGSELAALLGGDRAGGVGGEEALDDRLLGLELDSDGDLVLQNGKLSLDALRLLVHGARWRFGRGASRAALAAWKAQTTDSPEGVAAAMDVVWAHAPDGGALAALSDAQLRWWGVEEAEVRAAVLERVAQRCRVPVEVRRVDAMGNKGLGSADGGWEAMRRLGELLQLVAPRVEVMDLSECGLGGAAAHELARAVPHLPRWRWLKLTVNADLDPASGQHLRRAWARAGKPGVVNNDRMLGLALPEDVLTLLATMLWEALPCFETRKEVQAARAWPAGADAQLVAAARAGRTEAVRALVRRGGASPHAVDRDGDSALAAAQRAGQQDVVAALHELHGLHLHAACVRGDDVRVRKLINGKADVEARNERNHTALMVASERGQAGIVEQLLAVGAKADVTDASRMTALALAIAHGHEDAAKMLIAPTQAAGALDIVNDTGSSALMIAATKGLVSVTEQLLAAGAQPELTDTNKMTALALAIAHGHEDAAKMLIGPTEASGALDIQNDAGSSALATAAKKGLVSVTEQLLGAGAKADVTDASRMTALALAIAHGHEEAAKMLAAPTQAAGALDVVGDDGVSSLMAAGERGLAGVVKELLAAGAKSELADKRGRTALALACVQLGDLEGIPGSGTAMMATAEGAYPGALVLHGVVQHQRECLGVYVLVEGRTAHGRPVWKHVSQDRCIAKTSNGNWVVQRENQVGVKDSAWMLLRDTTGVLPHQSKAVWEVHDGKGHIKGWSKGWIPAPLLKCNMQEDFAKKKAQCKEVVALLIRPTQAASALDVLDDEGNTVLLHACKHGLWGVAEQLAAAGAKADVTDSNRMTALALAIAHGHEDAAKMLIGPTEAAGAIDIQNDAGSSALMIAATKGLVSVVDQLLGAGAKADVTDASRMTALALACVQLGRLSGAQTRAVQTAADLAVGCWVETIETFKGMPKDTVGQVKRIDGDGDARVEFEGAGEQWVFQRDFGKILVLSSDLMVKNKAGKMSLAPPEEVLKRKAQREEAVALLIRPTQAAGALDVVNDTGSSALMIAATKGFVGVTEQLLAAGAQPELTDANRMTALALAIAHGHEDAAKMLIAPTQAAGALDVVDDTGSSALMIAATKGLVSVTEQLLAAGAKPELTDANKMTALALACVQLGRVSGAQTTTAETAADLAVGCWVKTIETLEDVPKDTVGQVKRIVEVGQEHRAVVGSNVVVVEFEGAGEQWVYQSDFGKISVLSPDLVVKNKAGKTSLAPPEVVLERKAQREEAVTLLIRPTQAAGALDVVGDDGFSALLWAEERGLDSVAQRLRECGAAAVRRPALSLFRGEHASVQIKVAERTVAFKGSFVTVRSAQRCPRGSKGYYELEIIEHDDLYPQYGFAATAFERVLRASNDGVGDNAHSWAVDGARQLKWHTGEELYQCTWEDGDVIGLACDLDAMQMLISVNGSFAAPNGVVFELAPDSVRDGLFAAFTGTRGRVRYNLGEVPFKYAPPSPDFVAFSEFLDVMPANEDVRIDVAST